MLLRRTVKHDISQVLYLPFDRDDGAYARDRSGYKNHGTIYGATCVNGKIGNALSFDGVNDYVAVPDSPSIDITVAPLSIFAWIKVATDASGAGYIVAKNLNDAANIQYGFYWWKDSKNVAVYLEGVFRTSSTANS